MQPARRAVSSSRNLVIVSAAAVVGILVGGVSVLAVALAVIEPPTKDAPAGSAVFDGRPHVVQQAPAASPTEPQTTASVPAPTDTASTNVPAQPSAPPVPHHPAPPVEANSEPAPQRTPTQVLNKTWPEVPAARTQLKPETATVTPGPSAPKSTVPSTTTASVQGSGDTGSEAATVGSSHAKQTKNIVSRNNAAHSYPSVAAVPNSDTPRRVVVIPDDPQRHVVVIPDNAQPRDDDAEVASTESPRPLFNFFGRFDSDRPRDDNDRDVARASPPSPPQLRTTRSPRDPQLVIRHRQDRDDDRDAVNSSSPQYDSENFTFGFHRNDEWRN